MDTNDAYAWYKTHLFEYAVAYIDILGIRSRMLGNNDQQTESMKTIYTGLPPATGPQFELVYDLFAVMRPPG